MAPAEVARRLGVSPITVRSWVSKGWLTSHLTPGGHRRYLWADVERLLAERSEAITRLKRYRILVVDDDPQFRAFLVDALATLAPDAIIREAVDGFQAGTAMAEFHPDLVMLDYAMPGMNGASVCRQIKSSAAYAEIRVVALTGFADASIQAELASAGVDKFLFKPVPIKVIEDMLDQFRMRRVA